MRIDELIQTLVVNTDFAPVSPPALGPGYKATLAQIVSAGLVQPNSSTAGAGANLTIKAADGVTSGAGGSIVLQPGAQASTGGNGVVVVRQPGGTAGTNELQIFNTGLDTYFRTGTNANGGFFYFQRGDGQTMFYTTAGQGGQTRAIVSDNYMAASYSVTAGDQSNGVNLASGKILGFRNTGYAWTEGYTAGLGFATVGVIQVGRYNSSVSLTNGGSFAYPGSTPSALSANTNDLVLDGSAFQRVSASAAYNLTGIAPPTSGAHVDGRVIWLHNVGAFNITLKHSQTSTAANQFITETGGDLVLGPNRIIQCTYDGTSAKWRAHGENYPYAFPTTDGTSGQALTTNGSGTLSWASFLNSSNVSGTSGNLAKFTGTNTVGNSVATDAANAEGFNILTYSGGLAIGSAISGGGQFTRSVTITNATKGDALQITKTVADSTNAAIRATSGGTWIANFSTSAATTKGLLIQGFTSQSANLTEWQDSSANKLAAVSSNGTIGGKFFEVKNQYTAQPGQPSIAFTGAGNVPITLKVLDDSFGTLSFEGSAGQLFSINNNLTSGVIFAVNDVSGIPQIDVNADGTIRLAPFASNVQIAGMTVGRGGGGVSTNTAYGVSALAVNTTGAFNVAVGVSALAANTTANDSVAVGYNALRLSTGTGNVAVGSNALAANTTGNTNVAVGRSALAAATTGGANIMVGDAAGSGITTGYYSVGVGHQALLAMTTGNNNTALGYQALVSTTGSSNVGVGSQAIASVTTGSSNVGIGNNCFNSGNGSNNVFVGHRAGMFQADGSTQMASAASSVYVGYQARGFNNSDSNSVVIGADAIGKGANTTVLGNTSTTQAWVFGTGIIYNSGGANYGENLRLPESSLGWSVIHMGGAAAATGTGANQWSLLKTDSSRSHRFELRHNATEVITVLTGGNVGIGTTGPTSKFEVNNSGSTNSPFYVDAGNPGGTTTLFAHTGANTPVPFRLTKSGAAGSGSYGLLDLFYDTSTAGHGSNLYFSLDDSAGNITEYAGIGGRINSNTNGTERGDLYFYTMNSGTGRSERMVLRYDGNLGLGITNPGHLLQISGANENNATYYSQLRIDGTGTYPLNIPGISLNPNAAIQSHIRFLENGTVKAQLRYNEGSTQTNKLSVYSFISSTNVLTIDCSSQLVGINNYSPATALDIIGTGGSGVNAAGTATVRVSPTSQNTYAALELRTLNAGNYGGAGLMAINDTTYDSNLLFYTNASGSSTKVERMRITKDGLVGVNNTSPGAQFHVNTSSASNGGIFVRGSASQTAPLLAYQNNSGDTIGYTTATGIDTASFVDFTWTPNYSGGVSSPSAGTYQKTSGNNGAWDGQVYSSEGFAKNVYVSFKCSQTNAYQMMGLNADPSTDAVYSTLDFAWYPRNDGVTEIYESNASRGTFGGYTTATNFAIVYDGTTVYYLKDGVIMRSVARSISGLLYLDSSFFNTSGAFNTVRFGPSAGTDLAASITHRLTNTYNSASALSTYSVAKTILGGLHFNNGAGANGSSRNEAAVTFQGQTANESQAGIYVLNDNSNGTYMGFATTDSYATGPQLGLTITNAGVVNVRRSSLLVGGTSDSPTGRLEVVPAGSSGAEGIYINQAASHQSTIRFKSAHSADSDYRVGASILVASAFEVYSVNAAATRFIILSGGNVGIGVNSPGARLQIDTGAAATKGLIVKGFTSQSANLQEWQNSAGSVLASVDSSGNISTGGSLSATGALYSATDIINTRYTREATFIRAAPTTVGNYVEICNILEGGSFYEITALSDFGAGIGTTVKRYHHQHVFGYTGGVTTLTPIAMARQSGYESTFDFELELNRAGAYDVRLRLRRTAGTSARSVAITVRQYYVPGGPNTALTELSGTGTSSNVGFINSLVTTSLTVPPVMGGSGAGNSIGIYAGSGETSGAGGSILLQPGAQATTGGNGNVVIRQPGGTAGTDEIQMSHDGLNGYIACKDGDLIARANTGYIKIQNSTGSASARLNISDTTGGGVLYIDSCYQIQLSASNAIRSNILHYFGSGSENSFSASGISIANSSVVNFHTGASYNSSADVGFVRGGVGQLRVTNGSSGGGSFAYTSNTPSALTADQNDLVLTGSAFQRLSGTAARTITGIAPPTGGSHVDGRMIRIVNIGSFNLTFAHNSASSATANRFFNVTGANLILAPNDYAELIYDGTDNGRGTSAPGWRVF